MSSSLYDIDPHLQCGLLLTSYSNWYSTSTESLTSGSNYIHNKFQTVTYQLQDYDVENHGGLRLNPAYNINVCDNPLR